MPLLKWEPEGACARQSPVAAGSGTGLRRLYALSSCRLVGSEWFLLGEEAWPQLAKIGHRPNQVGPADYADQVGAAHDRDAVDAAL